MEEILLLRQMLKIAIAYLDLEARKVASVVVVVDLHGPSWARNWANLPVLQLGDDLRRPTMSMLVRLSHPREQEDRYTR